MRSIAAYVLLLAAGLVLLATLAFALVAYDVHRAGRLQTQAQLQETANVLSIAVDGELKRAVGILSTLAASQAVQTGNWARAGVQAQAALQSGDAWLVVQDRSGRQLLNMRLPRGSPLPAGPPRSGMWREPAGGKPRICDLVQGLTEPNIVCVDVPVTDREGRRYLLSIVFHPRYFETIVNRDRVEDGHVAALLDRSGRLIWRNINADKFVGGPATPDVRAAIRARPEGSMESTTLDGVRTLAAFRRSTLSGWTVIVGTPLEHAAGAAFQAQSLGSLAAIGLLVLGCLLALFVASRISKAVQQVSTAVRQGELDSAEPIGTTGFAEIDELQAALHEASAARSESEQRFKEVADAAPVLIWVADAQNKGIWFNRAWLDFTGRTLDQELGDGWIENVHPDDRAHAGEVCGGSFDRRQPFHLEFRLRRADGEWRTIEDRGVPRFAESGAFRGYVGSCVDVTDARRSEAAIRESEERFRRIFEQASDLIITADLDQVVTDCNPSAAAAVGLSRAEAAGRKISDFLSPEDFQRTTQMLRHKLEHGGTTRYDVRVRSSAGEWLLWEINSGLTFDEDGRAVGLHIVGRDVTERKRWETHQRLLVDELNHRVKNTLAIVQSLAHQTFRRDASPRELIAAFEARLSALASAHNLLTRENWESASIRDVVSEALGPFCTSDRCLIEGDELRLHPKAAVTLALAMHELATNAAKYGALASKEGRVGVTWAVDAGSFELLWREEGGPPVAEPSATGFGTRMIRRALAAELGGEVELRFESSGLVCRIRAPRQILGGGEQGESLHA